MHVVHLVGINILVPTRVESQQRLLDRLAVGINRILAHCIVGCNVRVIGTLAEVAQHVDRVLIIINTVILSRSGRIVVWGRETVDQLTPLRHLLVLVNHVSHVGARLNDTRHLLDISVLTGDVALNDLPSVHPCVGNVIRLVVRQDSQVLIANTVIRHVGRQEVNHRGRGGIFHQGDALATLLKAGPGIRVRHSRCRHDVHRVIDACCRLAAHGTALIGSTGIAFRLRVRHQLNQIGIVHHRVVQQQSLLGHRQLIIAVHSPRVVLEPFRIRCIVGSKQSFRTSVAKHLFLAQFVDKP